MKKIGLLVFALMIWLMSWEMQRPVAALFAEAPIPEQSIRLRIIANSDSPQDQWLKREIRDQINEYLSGKIEPEDTLEEARAKMERELPQLQRIVDETIRSSHLAYDSKVELGKAAFPTKMYGQYIYPAGEYEALRVTVGAGLGQNWWCVLFPPLCFVDIATGSAVKAEGNPDSGTVELAAGDKAPDIEVKFFLIEWLKKLFAAIFSS